jgi:hypothetical protein
MSAHESSIERGRAAISQYTCNDDCHNVRVPPLGRPRRAAAGRPDRSLTDYRALLNANEQMVGWIRDPAASNRTNCAIRSSGIDRNRFAVASPI